MDSLTVKRPVVVKIKVTENYKKSVALELQDAIRRVEAELQHLEFQSKRMVSELEKLNPQGIPAARQHLEAEKQKRVDSRGKLLEKVKEIGRLAIGSEIVHGTLDTITELRVGDSWHDLFGVEVILCDGRIIEIRGQGQQMSEEVLK